MSVESVYLRRGLYADSVTLMQVSRDVGQVDGVTAVLVAMATDVNVDILRELGFTPPQISSANDMVVAVRARDEKILAAALATVEGLLDTRQRTRGVEGKETAAPRTMSAAVMAAGPGIALISLPGQHAFTEAMDAVESGCDVHLFSDNVTVDQEVVLKEAARQRGVLVMGPDCGTSVIGGIAVGFAHTVEPGPVGMVAASGTGAQQVMCLLDTAGVGISAVLGVGGRDLSEAVGGRSTLAALTRLDADDGTSVIMVISKPPSPSVAERVRVFSAGLRKPVEFALLGYDEPDLTTATERLLLRLAAPVPDWPSWTTPSQQGGGAVRGLFCGGTLCEEAILVATPILGSIKSNLSVPFAAALGPSLRAPGHTMIDFGDDALTRGRAHPMIDPTLRNQFLKEALMDTATGVVQIDVLLGHAAHPDPVSDLVPLIANAVPSVVVTLVGSRGDPQNFQSSASRLRGAGASVFRSNAQATRYAVSLANRNAVR